MLRNLIPSMFHRRLLLLGVVAVVVLLVLMFQIGRLTVVQGADWRDRAERVLSSEKLIRTARGSIHDRYNRKLAYDRPSDDVAVHYELISGKWSRNQARTVARRQAGSSWHEMSEADRIALIDRHQAPFELALNALWSDLCKLTNTAPLDLKTRREHIVDRVETIAGHVHERYVERKERELGEDLEKENVKAQPIAEQRSSHALVNHISEDARLRIRRRIAAAEVEAAKEKSQQDPTLLLWSKVSIEASSQRAYPLETMTVVVDLSTFPAKLRQDRLAEVTVKGVAYQTAGDLRHVWKEDIEAKPYRQPKTRRIDLAGYLPGDRIGRGGVEAMCEAVLRGSRGRIVEFIDNVQQAKRIEPVAGSDVDLTIDARLQARVSALLDPSLGLTRAQPWHSMDLMRLADPNVPASEKPKLKPGQPRLGDPLAAAAVVIDIESGQILAAVSSPTFNLEEMRDNPAAIWQDHDRQPFVNRAWGRAYPPGSTIKPVVLLAAIGDKKIASNGVIECTGHLHPSRPHMHRCWIYTHGNGATHGPMSGSEAIARSCNIYFYTLGQRLGALRLVWWLKGFGIGQRTGCGLPEESAGLLPKLADARDPDNADFSSGSAIMMGIGQGRVEATVLQMANAYATIGRDGIHMDPILFERDAFDNRRRREDLRISKAGIKTVMKGMDDVTSARYGTAYSLVGANRQVIFNYPDAKVFGKSGTATAPPLRKPIHDESGNVVGYEEEPIRAGDHAWFVGLVQDKGSKRPDYAIAVMVEYGGSGGAVAGPIANQILYALRAEGYLD